MTIEFRPLFTLEIDHGYYRGPCRDFDFLLPADTAHRLRSARLLAKVREGKLLVLFEANETHAPLVSAVGAKLRIGLKLSNPWFSNLTDLDFPLGASQACYRNAMSPAALDGPVGVVLVGTVFHHALTSPDRPVTVRLKTASGATIATEVVGAENDRAEVAFDLYGQAPGAYTVEETTTAGTAAAAYYFDTELVSRGVFGVVEITIGDGFAGTPPVFAVSFRAREQTLKYYVVAKNYPEAEFNQLAVADVGFTEDARPKVEFERVATADFTPAEIPSALLDAGAGRVVLFKSQGPVIRTEAARRRIQLSKNGEVLIPHLPQPAVDRPDADLIVHVSKP